MILLLSNERFDTTYQSGRNWPQTSPSHGDRVQLQHVLMNPMINVIDGMTDMNGTRELAIESLRVDNEQLLMSLSDTCAGLASQQADEIFNAFLPPSLTASAWEFGSATLSLNRMVAACGLRLTLRAAPTFHFTLPANAQVPQ
jgi:light-regulated signal transduction histidine kinase (bacteriophytochrome)